jgi:hypothetical protein
MRLSAVTTIASLALAGLSACTHDSGAPTQSSNEPPLGSGGTTTTVGSGTGGNTPIGNGGVTATAKGGTGGSGGSGGTTTATTTTTHTGGSTANGGTGTGTGGNRTTTGGTPSRGGAGTGTGGNRPAGGTTATGGRAPTGGASTGGATTTATGGTSTGPTVAPLTNGTDGKTTRYWDCCKPSCGWKANAQQSGKSSPATSCGKDGTSSVGVDTQSICSGGTAYQCNWGAPWQVSSTLSYGYAAYNGNNCGKCYQLDFTGSGDNAGAQSLKGKSMIVQAVNIGNIASNQFDLLIPGGGVGANNGCSNQWNNADLGSTNGGFLAACGTNTSCVTSMCQTAFGSNSGLMAGCTWFTGWFASANNPGIKYAEVSCPAEITNKSGLK